MLFVPNAKSTKVVNIKVQYIKPLGYNDFTEWASDKNNVYIGRDMSRFISGAKGSKWGNPFKV
jgi:hypothetical protein